MLGLIAGHFHDHQPPAAPRLLADAEDRPGQSLIWLVDTLATMSVCAFVCDITGRVRAMTPLAQDLISAGNWLAHRDNRLFAARAEETRRLHAELVQACGPDGASQLSFVMHGHDGQVLPLEVLPLSAAPDLSITPLALLIARPMRGEDQRSMALAKALFGLTDAEAQVASGLQAGLTASAIAARRGVAVGTIRTHIRRLFEKAGVASQIELAALLNNR
ncbi:hypothetical protein GRI97_10885 [Altererythrobacter xixiisoli]|uniref:HTH luxR-type domain-containing protein n=1 Tax=Croceibacterium xixiisoli TaxID=1476466 RepID=A0A6I4TYQ0_9SPHN|nr:helix-turn-helix transcriptional regulator [Croceibacterium xixiisoli]MXO99493.1 hypothetical protein [Croceibacterium xixiisoli]